ncbi:hypothetical protein [Hymenobacter setariae]|uniref:hypothetical protein n=1 Tax=Hymenobacter setariae TaxID=2594794 RepID=UPI001F2780DD|nr:hypothetical protein [Hymenobacter setariae]
MYTLRRLRYATRWTRRLSFALLIVLLLFLSWRAYQARQQTYQPAPAPVTQLA